MAGSWAVVLLACVSKKRPNPPTAKRKRQSHPSTMAGQVARTVEQTDVSTLSNLARIPSTKFHPSSEKREKEGERNREREREMWRCV